LEQLSLLAFHDKVAFSNGGMTHDFQLLPCWTLWVFVQYTSQLYDFVNPAGMD
jgi:hypothetical protein